MQWSDIITLERLFDRSATLVYTHFAQYDKAQAKHLGEGKWIDLYCIAI